MRQCPAECTIFRGIGLDELAGQIGDCVPEAELDDGPGGVDYGRRPVGRNNARPDSAD